MGFAAETRRLASQDRAAVSHLRLGPFYPDLPPYWSFLHGRHRSGFYYFRDVYRTALLPLGLSLWRNSLVVVPCSLEKRKLSLPIKSLTAENAQTPVLTARFENSGLTAQRVWHARGAMSTVLARRDWLPCAPGHNQNRSRLRRLLGICKGLHARGPVFWLRWFWEFPLYACWQLMSGSSVYFQSRRLI